MGLLKNNYPNLINSTLDNARKATLFQLKLEKCITVFKSKEPFLNLKIITLHCSSFLSKNFK